MRRAVISGVMTAALAGSLLLAAHGQAAQRTGGENKAGVVDVRQAHMKRLGGATRTLTDYADGKVTDATRARQAAAVLREVSARLDTMWPAGTGVGVGDSATRPLLWKEPKKLAQRVSTYRATALPLAAAAEAGNPKLVGARLGAFRATCKDCHSAYQAKD